MLKVVECIFFDKMDDAIIAQGKLQIPYRPEYRISFNTLNIIDDIHIPEGKWGTANYLEPIIRDFKMFGRRCNTSGNIFENKLYKEYI